MESEGSDAEENAAFEAWDTMEQAHTRYISLSRPSPLSLSQGWHGAGAVQRRPEGAAR